MKTNEKIKDIRKRFGLSQEELANIIGVSRQAITKWETDAGIPDVSNLQELSKVFGITIDYLLNEEETLPSLTLKKELDKKKYKNKLTMFKEVLKEYYPDPYEIFVLSREKKLNFGELVLDTLIAPEISPVRTAYALEDLSSYYLVKKDNIKLLVNIKNYTLEVAALPTNTNEKKFVYNKNVFRNCGKVNLK